MILLIADKVFDSGAVFKSCSVYSFHSPLCHSFSNSSSALRVMVTHSQHDAGYATRTINLFDGQVVNSVRMQYKRKVGM